MNYLYEQPTLKPMKLPNKPYFLKSLNTGVETKKEKEMLQDISQYLEIARHVLEIIVLVQTIYKNYRE